MENEFDLEVNVVYSLSGECTSAQADCRKMCFLLSWSRSRSTQICRVFWRWKTDCNTIRIQPYSAALRKVLQLAIEAATRLQYVMFSGCGGIERSLPGSESMIEDDHIRNHIAILRGGEGYSSFPKHSVAVHNIGGLLQCIQREWHNTVYQSCDVNNWCILCIVHIK